MTDTPGMTPERIQAIAHRLDRPVVLVGLMGSGKSTVGRRLATLLGKDFIDSDTAVEEAAQRSVADIFEHFGEAHFRDGERRVIKRLIEDGTGVIATGGGAFVDPQTRTLIHRHAISIWLDCDVETLVARTSRRNSRPLLLTGDPHEILTRLHRERRPAYAEATIRIAAGETSHQHTVLRILEAIEQWL